MPNKIQGLTFPSGASRRIGLLATDADRERLCKQWSDEDYSKLLLLCQHYRIPEDPNMFRALALALARELYPEPKKRGRKAKWTTLNQGALVVEIERLVGPDGPAHGVHWAAQQLANREPWKSFLEKKESDATNPDPAEALRQMYYAFKDDRWADVSRHAFKFHEHQGTIAEWESDVTDVTDYVRN